MAQLSMTERDYFKPGHLGCPGCGAAIAVSADHTTDSNSGAHTADPVPALLCPPGADRSPPAGFNFGEGACRERGVPRRDGHAFLAEILDYLSS